MVNPNPKTFGGKPKPVAVFGRDGWPVSSSCGVHITLWEGASRQTTCVVDHPVGNSVGAIG
jgi:hypothetical protein